MLPQDLCLIIAQAVLWSLGPLRSYISSLLSPISVSKSKTISQLFGLHTDGVNDCSGPRQPLPSGLVDMFAGGTSLGIISESPVEGHEHGGGLRVRGPGWVPRAEQPEELGPGSPCAKAKAHRLCCRPSRCYGDATLHSPGWTGSHSLGTLR